MLRRSPPSLRLLPSPSLAASLKTDPVNFHSAPAAGCSGPTAGGGRERRPGCCGLGSGATPAPPHRGHRAERSAGGREGGREVPLRMSPTDPPSLSFSFPPFAWLSSPAEAAPVSSASWRAPTPARWWQRGRSPPSRPAPRGLSRALRIRPGSSQEHRSRAHHARPVKAYPAQSTSCKKYAEKSVG